MIWTAIPTWLITNCITPFLSKDHPWHDRWFTLRDWHDHRMPFTIEFDFVLWLSVPIMLMGLFILTR